MASKRNGRPPTARAAVTAAVERLIADERSDRLSVARICAEARVSRQAFYNNFDSAAQAVRAAVSGYEEELLRLIAPLLEHDGGPALDDALEESLAAWVEVTNRHPHLLQVYRENTDHDRELRDQLVQLLAISSERIATVIRAARSSGRAAEGATAETLGAVLMWGYERSMQAVLAGVFPPTDEPNEILPALRYMFLSSISYQEPPDP